MALCRTGDVFIPEKFCDFFKNFEPFEVSFPLIIIKAGKAEKADPRPGCKNAYQRQEEYTCDETGEVLLGAVPTCRVGGR